jgi:hypothetical protein
MSHFVRHDRFGVIPRSASDEVSPIFEEGKFPSSNSTHKGFKVFSGVSWEGGKDPFPICVTPNAVRGLQFN